MIRALVVLICVALAGCATKETKTSESEPRAFGTHTAGAVKFTPETIILDARPAFEFSTAHIPRSVNVAWSDYTEAEPAQRGIIQHDTFGAARRLARLGIGPQSAVVVVGDGESGGGEEGRVAWMLAYLGVENVQFARIDSLKPRLTNEPEAHPPAAVPIWKPEVREDLNATRDEVLFAINQNAFVKPASYKGAPARMYRFIDVRSARAYLGKEGLGRTKTLPNLEAINIPWKEFFTPDMRANAETLRKLKSMGYGSPNERVIVLDEDGVASAAVTMLLRDYGFSTAANASGGYLDLVP